MLDKTTTVFTVIRSPRKAGKVKVMLRRQNRLVGFVLYNKRGIKEYYLFYYAFK